MKLLIYILLIILLLSHIILTRYIKQSIIKKRIKEIFKIKVLMVPISITLSLILMKIIGLPLKTAGFTLGDITEGIRSIIYIGLPLALISSALVFTMSKKDLNEVKYGQNPSVWSFLYVWIFVGPVEEILYRGFVQGTLSTLIEGQIFFFSYSTILASVIFVLAHVSNVYSYNESWKSFLGMIPTRFIAAMVLGFSFQVSNSILYPIIIHNLIDGFNLTVLSYRKKKIKEDKEP